MTTAADGTFFQRRSDGRIVTAGPIRNMKVTQTDTTAAGTVCTEYHVVLVNEEVRKRHVGSC